MRILIPRPMPFRKSCLGQNQDNRNYGLSRLRNDVLHQQGDHQNARRPTEAWRLSRAAIRWRWLQGTTRCPWWFAHPCTSWHPSTIPMLLTRIRFTSSFLRPKSFKGWTERSSPPLTPKIWAQFHQRSMDIFYARRSQKHKKILITLLSSYALGSYRHKSCT